jgi:flagellar assembly factor FliW
MLNSLNGKVIHFRGSVLGFEQLDRFEATLLEEDGPYVHLQSKDDAQIGFLTANPFYFFSDYSFELSEPDKKELQVQSHEEVLVLGILTLKEPFSRSTMNLLAPLVINLTTLRGKQIVLPPGTPYDTRTAIFAKTGVESGGGSSC